MSKPVDVEVYLDLNVNLIGEEIDGGVLIASKNAAEELIQIAERRWLGLWQHLGTGEMAESFFDFKSRYEDGGWLAAVAHSADTKWEDTVGGRAHFFEYGRSAPGKGRASSGTGKPQLVRERQQPSRPYMRPARNKIKRKLGGITAKEIRQVARKMNRSPQLASQVMRAANRVA